MVARIAGPLIVTTGLLVALPELAAADFVDGSWCTPDGRRFLIDGDVVIRENGARIAGDYGRHHYVFKMPEGELLGGLDADIVLINKNKAHVRYMTYLGDEKFGEPEIWTRCNPNSS